MKRYYVNDTVEFRNGEQHLYGVIMKETMNEDGENTYTILAGKLLFRNVREAEIMKNFGSEE
jgi:hypothetical protein